MLFKLFVGGASILVFTLVYAAIVAARLRLATKSWARSAWKEELTSKASTYKKRGLLEYSLGVLTIIIVSAFAELPSAAPDPGDVHQEWVAERQKDLVQKQARIKQLEKKLDELKAKQSALNATLVDLYGKTGVHPPEIRLMPLGEYTLSIEKTEIKAADPIIIDKLINQGVDTKVSEQHVLFLNMPKEEADRICAELVAVKVNASVTQNSSP